MCQLFLENQLWNFAQIGCYLEGLELPRLSLSIKPAVSSTLRQSTKWFVTQVTANSLVQKTSPKPNSTVKIAGKISHQDTNVFENG